MREALGRADSVVSLPDDLSWGPIAGICDRSAWFEREVDLPGCDAFDGARADFWAAALQPGRRRVAWWTWRDAQEYCGFLEFVSRLGNEACDTVNLSEAQVVQTAGDGAPMAPVLIDSLPRMFPGPILRSGVLGRAEPLLQERRATFRDRWSRLRAEDAPLRVPLGNGEITSAPLSFFDGALLRNTRREWQRSHLAVSEVLHGFKERLIFQTRAYVLTTRIQPLAAAGQIDLRGDPKDILNTEIRLAERTAPSAQ